MQHSMKICNASQAVLKLLIIINSPDNMRFLWVQLDQNRFNKNSMQNRSATFNSAPTTLKGFDGKAGRL